MRIKPVDYLDSVSTAKNIRAFDRLSRLVFKKGWKVGKLNDRGTAGLLKCIKVWFELNDFTCNTSNGNIAEASRDSDLLIVEVVPDGYYSLSLSQKNVRASVVKGGANYLAVKSLADFLEKYDSLFDED